LSDSPTLLEQAGLKGRPIRCLLNTGSLFAALTIIPLTDILLKLTGSPLSLILLVIALALTSRRMCCSWLVEGSSLRVSLWPWTFQLPSSGLTVEYPSILSQVVFGRIRISSPGVKSRSVPAPVIGSLAEALILDHLKASGAQINKTPKLPPAFNSEAASHTSVTDADFGEYRLAGDKFQRIIACQVHWEVDLSGAEHRIEVREGRFGLEIRQLLILADGRHISLRQWSLDAEPIDSSLALELAARGVRSIICEASDREDFPLGLKEPSL